MIITNFYTDIKMNILYRLSGYDITSCFWSEVIVTKASKNATSDDCRVYYLGNGAIQENLCHKFVRYASLATSSRQQNVIEYYIEVHKTGTAGIESNNSATV